MTREEVEAGDSGGPINITPASRAGLRAEAGEKVGVFVFWDIKVGRDPNDMKFDVGGNGGDEKLESVEERSGGGGAHLVAFGEDT